MYLTKQQFVETAYTIILEQGIEQVTIRLIGEKLGCSSAALYKYFANLEELLMFACIRFLREYIQDLQRIIEKEEFDLKLYVEIWRVYCQVTYARPQIGNHLFFGPYSDRLMVFFKEYYALFGEEMFNMEQELYPLLTQGNIFQRNRTLLDICTKWLNIEEEEKVSLNTIHVLVYQGLLQTLAAGNSPMTAEQAVDCTLDCMEYSLKKI